MLIESYVLGNKFIFFVGIFVEFNVFYIEKVFIWFCKIVELEVVGDLYLYESCGSNGRWWLDWGINDGVWLMSIGVDDMYSI